MITLSIIVAVLVLATILFMQQPSFGKKPSGKRLERIRKSPNYKNGSFQNLVETPSLTGGATYYKVMREFFFGEKKRNIPDSLLPSVKRDLKLQPSLKPEITWFGHSSYLIQVNGMNILVDPVFSERTSPVQYAGTKAFRGSNVYTVDDMPRIDVLVLTHDHYDHLDYETVKKLKDRVGTVVTPLGVGEHLEYWGVPVEKIKELDWWEQLAINDDTRFIAAPARHFSGRGFKRNETLWSSFVFETKGYKIYIGGDSGYEKHFREIGNRFGPFDLVILENGQYNIHWANIHMMPEETVQAAIDLKAKVLFPVHWGKFALAIHPWDESINRVLAKADEMKVNVVTPQIGEQVIVDSILPAAKWWSGK
jgi:L-ascorbate metabolism protein UlaG (beta-lactamase superfamily)